MDKKCDSVKQIIDTCNLLISECKDSECVDVNSLVKTLKEECDVLQRIFDEDAGNTSVLNIQKNIVEDTAIRLEFFMRVRFGLREEENKLREFAAKLYEDTKQATLELSRKADVNPIELAEWGERTKWALKFYARSKHILFVVDNEDEMQIRSISIALERLGK